MSALKSECRKFQPNVFNKSKCQNCFRTKESHSAEALENNRASRNVSKCGYLFVAPDWDFSVSVNRTKRWQRRWFVLYDDGELTYSLDEFPETIPQGKIDMNSALEVSDAEGVTGNEFALAIATSEKVHFVKGTSREESKWWFDVLSKVLPRHLIRKHKRNATFPCGNVTIPSPAVIAQELCTEDDLHLGSRRPKFLSTSELQRNDVDWMRDDVVDAEEDVFSDEVEIHNALNDLMSAEPNGPTSQTEEQIQKDYLSQLEELESRRRNRRYLKRENRVQRNQRGRIAKMIPARNRTESSSLIENNASAIAAAEKLEYLESIHSEEDQKDSWSQCDPDLPEVSPKNVNAYSRNPSNLRKSESLRDLPKETNQMNGIRRYHSFKSATSAHKRVGVSSLKRTSKHGFGTLPRSATSTPLRQDHDSKTLTSNVPESPSSDLSYEHSEDGVFRRTGWLFRETLSRDWSRHWFVLQDASLSYYRDPHSGIMDGILDLNQVSSIRETKRDRHYAFSLLMWDGKKHVLASESQDSRERWLQALQYASNLWSSASKEDFICNEIILPEHSFNKSSLDASHGYSSDDQSEYFSLVDEDEVSELSSSPRTLPPSPPINRNMMSMVKEKSRIRHPKTNHDKDTLCSTLADGSIEVSRVNGNYQSNPLNIENHKPDETHLPLEFDKQVLINFPSVTYNCDITPLSNSSSPIDECLMCFSVKSKLVTAKEEIRKLKRELKEAHSNFDNLEMLHYKITQDMKAKEDNYNSQISLMTAKIDDLTSKFSVAEKNYRQLKQKSAKTDGKERKRSSLKNREGLSLTKEYEQKLCDLEKKIGQIEIIFDRRSSETDSESINSLVQSKIEDSRLVPSELSDTSTSTDLSTSSGKGFFARLQSLGTKIQNVDVNLAERNKIAEEVESPQICLQVQEKDVPPHIISEEWCSIPIANDLNCVAYKKPENILDCQVICIQKVKDILKWLNNSLKNISKNVNMKNQLSHEKVELVRNIVSFIDPLCEEIFPEMLQSNKINIHKSFLWSLEILKILERIESFENMDGLIKFDVTENAFKILFKTFVLTFAEYNNTVSNDILQMIANLPQIRFFCPMFTNFFPELESSNESESSIHTQWQSLIKEKSNILKSVQQMKNLRYESLWNTLTEVPVQETSSTKRSKSASSILNNVISISTDIHRIAEHQITAIQQRCFLLKEENDQVQLWCTNTVHVLKDGLLEFLDEIKEQCPMIHESTVALSDLGESTRKEITSCVSELSVLSVFHSILQNLLSYSVKVPETSTSGDSDSSSAQQEWSQHIWRNYTLKGVTFSEVPKCSQCILLNEFLCGRQSWEDFVLNYKLCSNQWNDYLTSRYNIPRCLNCESHFQTNKANDVCNNLKCTNCENWIQKVYSSEKQHALDKKELEVKHGEEIEQLEECLIKSTELHDKELSEKEIELCNLKTQLQRFQNNHEEQMSSLKHLYEQNLHFDYNNLDEDKIRRKYQLEIQDLKELFKKGLVAIENSHYRITTEMEKRHQEQMLQLKLEKEEALELEAKATLTALKAIKISHDERLLEETAIIKENIIKKMQHNDNSDLFLEKYGGDLVQLKSEIVTMTEMYSAKCLENIALEERLDTLRDQLEEAHNQLCDLLSKNREINLSPLAV